MKANYQRKSDCELVAKVSTTYLIDAEMIQKAICLISSGYNGRAVTTKAVINFIKNELYTSGLTWFDYGFYNEGHEITEEIVDLSYQLFPTFRPKYNIKIDLSQYKKS